MGWRAWDSYETERERQVRALPLLQRVNWRGCLIVAAVLMLAVLLLWRASARAESVTLTDAQVAAEIIQASRASYYATGHPCACPYDHARNGSMCGRRSAYSRPGGADPKCYPQDVSKQEIERYRRASP
jgi:hypothetical protein